MNNGDRDAADEYHDGNERDVEQKQAQSVSDAEAVKQDADIDADDVRVLPGTGGPDDGGDVDLEPEGYNREG